LNIRITSDIEEFKNSSEPKLNYSAIDVEDTLQIKPQGLLFEFGVGRLEIDVQTWKQLPVFFYNNPDGIIPFDFLSATFYLISRYEEYYHPDYDNHGRFLADNSLAYKYQFLQKPLIDLWLLKIKQILKSNFPELLFKDEKFMQINSFDIDQTFSYKGKGFGRNVGGLFRDLFNFDYRKVSNRLMTLLGINPDPFDVFDYLQTTLSPLNHKSIFFYLLGDYGKQDKNLPFDSPEQMEIIRKLTTWTEVGIHPSYGFSRQLINEKNFEGAHDKLNKELSRLRQITAHQIIKSRLHYLKFQMPDTFRLLAQAGIQHDYSMCYSAHPGFRASTAFPFQFFDLENNVKEHLWIHPTAIMDVSLAVFQNRNCEEGLDEILKLKNEVKKVNGEFTIIWHNESLSETGIWKGWRTVFEKSLLD